MKVRYTEVRKRKRLEAKGSWDNFKLRKAGKKQAKIRPCIYKKEYASMCELFENLVEGPPIEERV